MRPVNEQLSDQKTQEVHKNWTPPMQEKHKEVIKDFRSGHLKWSDISMQYIKDMGRSVLDKVLRGADETFRKIRDALYRGSLDSLDGIKKAEKKVEGFVRRIFPGLGGL